MQEMYSKKHLLKALKEAGLPASYPTMLEYEKKGILPEPTKVVFSDREWRLYSSDQIKQAVTSVANHIAQRDGDKDSNAD